MLSQYYFTMKWPAQIHSTVWRNFWKICVKIYIPWFCSFCNTRSSDRWCWRSPRSFDRCFGDSTFTGQLWFSAGCLLSSTNQCSGCRLTWLGDFRDISRWFWFDKLLMKRVFCKWMWWTGLVTVAWTFLRRNYLCPSGSLETRLAGIRCWGLYRFSCAQRWKQDLWDFLVSDWWRPN